MPITSYVQGWSRAILLLLWFGATVTVNAADDDPLRELRWENRVLLVFATNMADAEVAEMRAIADASREDLVDRDLVFGWVLSDEESRLDGRPVSPEYAERLRGRAGFGAEDFGVVLVGKDGGIKARYDGVPDIDAVFALIDGMPMRRREMRK